MKALLRWARERRTERRAQEAATLDEAAREKASAVEECRRSVQRAGGAVAETRHGGVHRVGSLSWVNLVNKNEDVRDEKMQSAEDKSRNTALAVASGRLLGRHTARGVLTALKELSLSDGEECLIVVADNRPILTSAS